MPTMHYRERIEIRARRDICREKIELYFIKRHSDGKLSYLKNPEFETIEPDLGVRIDYDNLLTIDTDAAQMLIDALWDCGIRPSEGSGSAGSLKATENHLADMQKLSWRLLGMIEK